MSVDAGEVTVEAPVLLLRVMLLGMCLQIVLVHGYVITFRALEQLARVHFLDVKVGLYMGLEVESLRCGVAALRAIKELLLIRNCMQYFVTKL